MGSMVVDVAGSLTVIDETSNSVVFSYIDHGVIVTGSGVNRMYPWDRVYYMDGVSSFPAPTVAISGLANPLPVSLSTPVPVNVTNSSAIAVHLL